MKYRKKKLEVPTFGYYNVSMWKVHFPTLQVNSKWMDATQ